MNEAGFTTEELQPFGLMIKAGTKEETIGNFSREQIFEWLKKYRYVVLRGFRLFEKQAFALYAQQLGEPLQWPFGSINELKVKADSKNYLYTKSAVPLHWDGAFVGKIPHVIFFQCVKAPKPEDKGGTVFTDTTRVLTRASEEQKKRWGKIFIRYKTEKVVHYGGEITQRLIDGHPVTGETVMRYAEPVHDLNPVELKVRDHSPEEQETLIRELHDAFYDEAVCVTHTWQDGDILMADNHALLHGREAFANANERHIQRINVMERPEKMSLLRWLKLNKTIRRSEFFVAELPIFFIAMLITAAQGGTLFSAVPWIGLAAVFLLFNIGDMINCYEDYELDAIYKSHLSNAVYELGKKQIKWQIIFSAVGGLLLTVIASWLTGRWWLPGLVVTGGFFGIYYSSPPIKFKSRGVWQLLCLWGIIFFGPMMFLAMLMNGMPSLIAVIIYAAYGFHQMGIILLNTAEDYTEDKAAGLRTIIVALGIQRSMRMALGMIFIFGLFLLMAFYWLLMDLKATNAQLLWFIWPIIEWRRIVDGFRTIVKKIKGMNDEDATKELKANGMKVPQWLESAAYTFLVLSLIYYFTATYQPAH